jgi:lincosamide nucleotidyltransferase A/C/D/E
MLVRVEEQDVLDLLDALEALGVGYWLDGGWGVDCLLGEQTRTHGDLDLVVPRVDLDRVTAMLTARGFTVFRDWRPTAVAFADPHGLEVDLHLVDTTADGGGDQVLADGGSWHYSAPVAGSVSGRTVRCASAEDQLLLHQGYELRPVDVADVRRLCERFGLDPPASYQR